MARWCRAFTVHAICGALVGLPVAAGEPPAPGQVWHAASDDKLEQMRGGFRLNDRLTVTFGIVRSVEINGTLVSSSALQIGDLRSIDLGQAEQLARLNLVQSGTGNTVATSLQTALPSLVVQNTLNDQTIRTLTEINAVSNGMSLLKGLNVAQSLNDALNAATRR